jgi:hypothetical protein
VSRADSVHVSGWLLVTDNAGARPAASTPESEAKLATSKATCEAAFKKTYAGCDFDASPTEKKYFENMVEDCGLDMVAFPETEDFVEDYQHSMCENWREEAMANGPTPFLCALLKPCAPKLGLGAIVPECIETPSPTPAPTH